MRTNLWLGRIWVLLLGTAAAIAGCVHPSAPPANCANMVCADIDFGAGIVVKECMGPADLAKVQAIAAERRKGLAK